MSNKSQEIVFDMLVVSLKHESVTIGCIRLYKLESSPQNNMKYQNLK